MEGALGEAKGKQSEVDAALAEQQVDVDTFGWFTRAPARFK